ncbi:MFS transporter [Streptomyces sp. NPDC001537]
MNARTGSALTFGVEVALVAGVTLGNGGANVMPVFVDDFATRYALSDSTAGLVAATQLMATAVVTPAAGQAGGAAGAGAHGPSGPGCLGRRLSRRGDGHRPGEPGPGQSGARRGAGRGLRGGHGRARRHRRRRQGIRGHHLRRGRCDSAADHGRLRGNHDLGGGTGFLLMGLCCVLAWPLLRRLPDGVSTPAAPDAGSSGTDGAASARPTVVLLLGTGLLWVVTQGAWSYASVLGRQHTAMSNSAVSAVLAVSSVVALVGALVGPLCARHFGRMRSMAAFVTAQALAMAVLIVTHDPVVFTVAAVLWQACQLAVLVQMLAAAALIDPTGRLVASLSGPARWVPASGRRPSAPSSTVPGPAY